MRTAIASRSTFRSRTRPSRRSAARSTSTSARRPVPALRIDGGVNYEFSHLKVRGDATADRALKFLKPNLTLDWKPGGGWHTQLSVRRTVAQLDFYDFISVGELSTNRVNGGNADLQPQRSVGISR